MTAAVFDRQANLLTPWVFPARQTPPHGEQGPRHQSLGGAIGQLPLTKLYWQKWVLCLEHLGEQNKVDEIEN